jgi:hypothetical protein
MGEKGLIQDGTAREASMTTQDGTPSGGLTLADAIMDDAEVQKIAGDLKPGDAKPPMTNEQQQVLIDLLIEKTFYEYMEFVKKMEAIEEKEFLDAMRKLLDKAQENAKPPAKDEGPDVQKVEGDLNPLKDSDGNTLPPNGTGMRNP